MDRIGIEARIGFGFSGVSNEDMVIYQAPPIGKYRVCVLPVSFLFYSKE